VLRSVGYLNSRPELKLLPLDAESAREIDSSAGGPVIRSSPAEQKRGRKGSEETRRPTG